MTENDPIHIGQCECGGVSYRINGPMRAVFNCHCLRCRRFTGHHMAATSVLVEHLTFVGDKTLRWYSPADDASVHYGFCGECGSSLFWRSDAHPNTVSICAGPLEGPTGLTTTQAWFVRDAADYHERPSGLIEFDTE